MLFVALLGGVAPAAVSAVLSGLLLNYFLTEPRYIVHHRRTRLGDHEIVLLLMAVAVAVLVDRARSRERGGQACAAEAELLTLFSGSVLRGADLDTLLERVRETYSQRAVSVLRVLGDEEQIVACVVTIPV